MAEDRSLSSGMSFPQWMKNRINDRSTFDHNTFSPPQADDSFLHIKYRKNSNTSPTAEGQQTIKPQILRTVTAAGPTTVPGDFSGHTDPCKKFIDLKVHKPPEKPPRDVKPKSNGTDDGFKGDGAACGSSVIRVAHQMVNSKFATSFSTAIIDEEPATEPANFDRALRRGSKSLPSSPLSSPKSSRRMPPGSGNRYFGAPAIEGGWILSGLLRKNRLTQSVSVITEEDSLRDPTTMITKSVSQMSVDGDFAENKATTQKVKRSRAAELREMNFYSPTSM